MSKIVDFLMSIEGAGYGGMADYEAARTEAIELSKTRSEYIRSVYFTPLADQLEKAANDLITLLDEARNECERDDLAGSSIEHDTDIAVSHIDDLIFSVSIDETDGPLDHIIKTLRAIDKHDDTGTAK